MSLLYIIFQKSHLIHMKVDIVDGINIKRNSAQWKNGTLRFVVNETFLQEIALDLSA